MANILLVHGAIADGSSWAGVIQALQAAGHHVVAAQQPLSSIPDDVQKVRELLDTLDGETVVVGHSFGGFVISNAAKGAPNVKSLVYVAAFGPEEGESAGGLTEEYGALPSASKFVLDPQGRFTLSQDDYVAYFAPDLPEEQARINAATQGPSDAGRFTWASGAPAWKDVPTWYVVAGNDQIINPKLEAACAERMGAQTTVIEGASHSVMLSHPEEVVKVILAAAA